MEERQVIFRDTHVRTTNNPEHIIKAVNELYSDHPDWEIGNPTIRDLGNGMYQVSIPLTKYAPRREDGLSR